MQLYGSFEGFPWISRIIVYEVWVAWQMPWIFLIGIVIVRQVLAEFLDDSTPLPWRWERGDPLDRTVRNGQRLNGCFKVSLMAGGAEVFATSAGGPWMETHQMPVKVCTI